MDSVSVFWILLVLVFATAQDFLVALAVEAVAALVDFALLAAAAFFLAMMMMRR